MKRFSHAACFLLILCCIAAGARADLGRDVNALLRDKSMQKVEIGVEIARLGASPSESAVLYRHQSDIPLIPASNLKLVTTAAAIDRLGADFKFRTGLFMYDGSLVLLGDGDPALGDATMLKRVGWDVDTVFLNWAEQLKKRGITQIKDLLVDDSVFDEQFLHPSWPTDQEHKWYVAQVGGLNLNVNCVDFLVQTTSPGQVVTFTTNPTTRYVEIGNTCLTGKENAIWLSRISGGNQIVLRGECRYSLDAPVNVTVHDPSMYTGTVLAETLARQGITMTGTVVRHRETRKLFEQSKAANDGKWTALAVHETPMSAVLARANKDSINLYAEALSKRIGHAATNEPGSWANGAAAIGEYLKKIGVGDGEFHLDDGSGLSRLNQVSANLLVQVLAHNFNPAQPVYLNSLAVAGQDGTLDDRFKGSDLRGRVFAKSGYINGVRSLSGYLRARDEQWYAFSILMNGPGAGGWQAKVIQEKIVAAIDANTERVADSR